MAALVAIIAVGIVLACIAWCAWNWDDEAPLVLAIVFALIAIIVAKIPVATFARWFA
jgi:hypothetical protein